LSRNYPGQAKEDYITSAVITASPNTHNQTAVPDVDTVTSQDRLQELPDVLEFCKVNGLPADLVGQWVWIRFDEKPDTETRDLLKAAGFRWIHKRQQWAHNCGPVSEISRDEIRSLKGVA